MSLKGFQTPKSSAVSLKTVKNKSGQPTKEHLALLEKIAAVAGGQLLIDEVGYDGDPAWVRFHIHNQPDALVLRKLEQQEHRLYRREERVGWQITCPSDPSPNLAERGLWLHQLDPAARCEYKFGCWFY